MLSSYPSVNFINFLLYIPRYNRYFREYLNETEESPPPIYKFFVSILKFLSQY